MYGYILAETNENETIVHFNCSLEQAIEIVDSINDSFLKLMSKTLERELKETEKEIEKIKKILNR